MQSPTPSWSRCEQFLRQNQKGTVRWLPLLRDGRVEWNADERSMSEDGLMSESRKMPMTIEMAPVDLATITRESWLKRVKELKKRYPALGVVGVRSAAKLMQRSPGVPVQFDSSSGFISSIGLNVAKYRDAETQGWNPTHGKLVTATPLPIAKEPTPSVLGKRPAPVAVAAVATAGVSTARVGSCKRILPAKAAVAGRDPSLYAPPTSALKQQARYAGTCQPLKKYLTQRRLWTKQHPDHWDAIREWCKTSGGREWLRECGLDPEGVHLDHIHDKKHIPINHAFNCYFMPGGANSHFGDRSDDDKVAYVGDQAWTTSWAFITWYIKMAGQLSLDCSKFTMAKALMA